MTTETPHKAEPKLAFGTYEQAKAMVGTSSKTEFSEFPINWPMVKYYCAAVEDGNPSYWDPEFAEKQWGGIIAPPGTLMTWPLQLLWRPGGARLTPFLAFDVPLPGKTLINASTETEFFKPLKVGDIINVYDTLVDVSPEKETKMGIGHFVTTLTTYRNQDGEVIAKNTNVLFRFNVKAA